MLSYFKENSLSLNLSKSGYLIINGKVEDCKCNLILHNGILEYKSVLKYLGIKISDTGNLKNDIDLYVNEKRSNVSIKYSNFCRKNFLAPLNVKITVLNSCVSTSLTYACETWGVSSIKKVEAAFRQGLKTALSIRDCVNNEIVYVESGEWPLELRITKQQLKFWLTITDITEQRPDHYISKLVRAADNTAYVKFYKNLATTFTETKKCVNILKNTFKTRFDSKIRDSARDDEDSKLGAYLLVNPTLSKPLFEDKLEFQRVLITRYRTGSHNLRIEKDRRFPNSTRNDRICKCSNGIQTVKHVILQCSLLNHIREKYNVIDITNGIFNENFLLEMECILGIKR